MQFNTYGGNGSLLAAALVNTTDRSPAALTGVLREHSIKHPEVAPERAAELADWCARLSPVFGEADTMRQVELVNGLLEDGATRVRVAVHDGYPPHLHYLTEEGDLVARVRATTSGGLAVAVCGAGGHRLGRCAREGCGTVFVDTSRNGRRRFCGVACANRVNVALHRARRSGRAGATR
ncbi:CGNR zinc finger domain-containing protein [Halostreptopolyspora alba]|uniref:CGNR zinc finger domain-containing protein n=1 Tax=Halostreptopolyspora alba TaxID=2487137 RepID=A0A3N0EBV8_9ACTN|nr:CGNR zinc finger domain-containing protein [Nocardiopsaceae bacterium YIM 96095]